ncbi:MAG: OmpA family protein [Pseudomonadota bacterium]
MIRAAPYLALLASALPLSAQTLLELPLGAEVTLSESTERSSYELPIGPFAQNSVEFERLTGAVRRQVWRIDEAQAGPGVLLAVLSQQIADAGFSEEFVCMAEACGGFDFRFAIEVAPEPAMHVNILDYGYAAFAREPDERVSILVSEGGGAAYIQMIEVGPSSSAFEDVTISTRGSLVGLEAEGGADFIGRLRSASRAPMPGVNFDFGSTQFAEVDLPALQDLAAFLRDNPAIEIVLVGHTDADGGLNSNIAVSRARAQRIRSILLETYGIAPGRVDAQGVGYLMPLAPNSSQQGRELNRRVEVVVLNIE